MNEQKKERKKEYISSHILEKLPERMKAARERAGYTKSRMARLLMCSHSIISMYETGERVPSLEVLVEFCSATRINPAWLLGFHTHKYIAPRESTIKKKIDIKGVIDHISDEREIEALWYLFTWAKNLGDPAYPGVTPSVAGTYIADPLEYELENEEDWKHFQEYNLERAIDEREKLSKRLADIESMIKTFEKDDKL